MYKSKFIKFFTVLFSLSLSLNSFSVYAVRTNNNSGGVIKKSKQSDNGAPQKSDHAKALDNEKNNKQLIEMVKQHNGEENNKKCIHVIFLGPVKSGKSTIQKKVLDNNKDIFGYTRTIETEIESKEYSFEAGDVVVKFYSTTGNISADKDTAVTLNDLKKKYKDKMVGYAMLKKIPIIKYLLKNYMNLGSWRTSYEN